jgi:hypothetical protein
VEHPTLADLHDAAYGFSSADTRHLEACGRCRGSLEDVERERAVLRRIFQKELPAARRRLASKLVAAAAAAAFLAGLVALLWAPREAGVPAQDDAAKILSDLESNLRKASTLKLRYYRRSYEAADVGPDGLHTRSKPFDSGVLLVKEGNRIHFVRREPVTPPGGLDKEFVTVSDGKKFASMMRDVGEVFAEATGGTPAGLGAQVVAGMTRGGIDVATLLMPDASAPLDSKASFWELPEIQGAAISEGGAGTRRLTYRLGKEPSSPRVTLWFEPKSLLLVRMAREDATRGHLVEIYDGFSLNEPIADAEFVLPPGQKEASGEDIELADYLDLKKGGKLREVWIEDRDLRADLTHPLLKDGKKHFKVHVLLPADLIATEKAVLPLIEGLDPARVHRAAKK